MAHIFQLGRKYAESLDLKVLDRNGKLVTVTMGSYGVGVSRAVAAVAEGSHDEFGLVWPREIAPAYVHVVATGKAEEVFAKAAEVRDGDECPSCGQVLETARGIEMGHIFQLGRKYAESLGLKVLDQNGKLVTVTMGSYGVGVSRAVAAVAEGCHDEFGLVWPREIAPADVHVVATGKAEEVFAKAAEVTDALAALGIQVIYDDRRKVSPVVKFKDA